MNKQIVKEFHPRAMEISDYNDEDTWVEVWSDRKGGMVHGELLAIGKDSTTAWKLAAKKVEENAIARQGV